MSMTLTIDRSHGNVAVVALQGEIDLQQSPAVRRELMQCLNDRWDVVVDLAKVDYIDSSGIASLVEAFQTARRLGTRFSLAAVSSAAMRVLKLARLDEVFVIHGGTAAALAADA
jgi:anti-sigma B factor antagonist